MAEDKGNQTAETGEKPVNKNKKYRRDKPWDHEGIDHWKVSVICMCLYVHEYVYIYAIYMCVYLCICMYV